MLRTTLLAICTPVLFCDTASAGDYKLVVKDAKIAGTKSNGAGWDAIGAPDPFVVAGLRAREGKGYRATGETKVDSDTYRPDWNESLLSVDVGDDVVIQVWDKDIANDDPIGEYKFTITRKMVIDGEARVSFDRVDSLRFTISRR